MTPEHRIIDIDRVGGLGLLLDRVSERLTRDFNAALADFGIRHLHLAVLSTVRRFGPMPQAHIAAYLGIERQTMANLTDDLEDRGLALRTAHPNDRRSWAVRVTPAGEELLRQAIRVGRQHEAAVFGSLSATDQADLLRCLEILARSATTEALFQPPA